MTMTAPADLTYPQAPPGVFPFGAELRIELGDCDPAIINDPIRLSDYVRQLIKLIGMEAYGDPILLNFGKESLHGWTLIQPITTSNINIHGVPDGQGAVFNIISCGPFAPAAALEFTLGFFGTDTYTYDVTRRDIPRRTSPVQRKGTP